MGTGLEHRMITPVAVDCITGIAPGHPGAAKIMHSWKRITFVALAGREKTPGKDTTRPYYRILNGSWEK
jgi:hypothetical protein